MRISPILFVGLSLCAGFALAQAAPPHRAAMPGKMAMPAKAAAAPVVPGCAYKPINIAKFGMQPFQDAPVIATGADHTLTAVLNVQYTDRATTSIAGCPVHLRTYNGKLVGPTLKVRPGDTMDITLTNAITHDNGPASSVPCPLPEAQMAQMMSAGPINDLDITNLHTHGLHVSPSGNSDNVFLEICPGQTQKFVIAIPKDQPPGTYWYHAHVHGSTAVQVSSGMEGAIQVDGGQDEEVAEIAKTTKRTFLLQQISYNEQGEIESLSQLTPSSWPDSKRVITVNGQIAPRFTMKPGEVQLFRFIHGGVRETIDLYSTSGTTLDEIATDGNATGRVDAWKQLELNPGYRSDVLFKAPMLAPGQKTMQILLRTLPLKGAQRLQFRKPANLKDLNAQLAKIQPGQVVAVIDVEGAPDDMALPTDAQLARFVPFPPITPGELKGAEQHMAFSIENAICNGQQACTPCDPAKVKDGSCGIKFMVDNHQYPDSPVRELKLNTASKWDLSVALSSVAPVHPFHIHVNPFEMVRAGPDGKPQTVWKDTLLIHQGQPVTVLSRYTDFDGAFVLHCHILDHEDQGMMQKVEILK